MIRTGLLLVTMIVASAAWDLRAVLTDRRLSGTDTTFGEAIALKESIDESGGKGALEWLRGERRLYPFSLERDHERFWIKGPLAGPIVLALRAVVGDAALAGRLLSVLLHCLLIGLCFTLGRRATGRTTVGLLGALLAWVHPGVFGWHRLAFHEPLVAAALVWTLILLVGPSPGARAQRGFGAAGALQLGVATAAGSRPTAWPPWWCSFWWCGGR